MAAFSLSTLLLPVGAYGGITINFGAADLRVATVDGGGLMPSGGLVIIEASTLDATFGVPSLSGFVSGDDIEIARGTVGPDGQFSLSAAGLTFSGDWNQGDPLLMRWFPSLTLSSSAPAGGTHFGQFRTDSVIDGSQIAWFTPPNGDTDALNFLTFSQGGSNPNDAGLADLTVVPEPMAYPSIFALCCLVGTVVVRKFRP